MKPEDYIDADKNFHNTKVKTILNILKPALMCALDKALKILPQEYIVDSIEKCNTSELKRQYLAVERGLNKWQDQKYAGRGDRPERSVRLIQTVLFTMLSVEAHYQVLTAFMLDEYRKIREKNERVD